jgi:hypothetical protein
VGGLAVGFLPGVTFGVVDFLAMVGGWSRWEDVCRKCVCFMPEVLGRV